MNLSASPLFLRHEHVCVNVAPLRCVLFLQDLVDSDGTPDSDMLGMTISADAASAALAVHAPTTCGTLTRESGNNLCF